MTDNEIIKALECCSVHPMKCKKCPYNGNECCTNAHRKDSLDLIKRQKAEIERLKEILGGTSKVLTETCAGVRAEAIKEFAEKVKTLNLQNLFLWNEQIDNLVKEMVGEG